MRQRPSPTTLRPRRCRPRWPRAPRIAALDRIHFRHASASFPASPWPRPALHLVAQFHVRERRLNVLLQPGQRLLEGDSLAGEPVQLVATLDPRFYRLFDRVGEGSRLLVLLGAPLHDQLGLRRDDHEEPTAVFLQLERASLGTVDRLLQLGALRQAHGLRDLLAQRVVALGALGPALQIADRREERVVLLLAGRVRLALQQVRAGLDHARAERERREDGRELHNPHFRTAPHSSKPLSEACRNATVAYGATVASTA